MVLALVFIMELLLEPAWPVCGPTLLKLFVGSDTLTMIRVFNSVQSFSVFNT